MMVNVTTDEAERVQQAVMLTAGVSTREAVKHLVIATRLLDQLDIGTDWLRMIYQMLADLAHELDPQITPYPDID